MKSIGAEFSQLDALPGVNHMHKKVAFKTNREIYSNVGDRSLKHEFERLRFSTQDSAPVRNIECQKV